MRLPALHRIKEFGHAEAALPEAKCPRLLGDGGGDVGGEEAVIRHQAAKHAAGKKLPAPLERPELRVQVLDAPRVVHRGRHHGKRSRGDSCALPGSEARVPHCVVQHPCGVDVVVHRHFHGPEQVHTALEALGNNHRAGGGGSVLVPAHHARGEVVKVEGRKRLLSTLASLDVGVLQHVAQLPAGAVHETSISCNGPRILARGNRAARPVDGAVLARLAVAGVLLDVQIGQEAGLVALEAGAPKIAEAPPDGSLAEACSGVGDDADVDVKLLARLLVVEAGDARAVLLHEDLDAGNARVHHVAAVNELNKSLSNKLAKGSVQHDGHLNAQSVQQAGRVVAESCHVLGEGPLLRRPRLEVAPRRRSVASRSAPAERVLGVGGGAAGKQWNTIRILLKQTKSKQRSSEPAQLVAR